MLVSDVIGQARVLLQDTKVTYRYSDSVMIGFVNQALKRMLYFRPDLFTTIGSISLTQDTVVQSLPSGGVRLVEIFSVSGGSALLEVSREMLDLSTPTWVSDTAGTPVNYARHVRNPTKFFVYPRPTAGVSLIGEYVNTPATYTAVGNTIANLPDTYLPSLVDCVVFLAESVDDEHVNSGRAKLYYDSFVQSLGANLGLRPLTDTEDAGLAPQPGYARPQRQVI
jgi:hypothetical protein